MDGIIRFMIGLAIALCGGLVLYNSASMSFQGYEREFASLVGAGLIGVGISGLAFLCAGAIGIAWRLGLKDVAVIAAVMSVACFAGDVYGNSLATVGEVNAKTAVAIEAEATYQASAASLPVIRDRIKTAQSELATVAGEDIRAAQRLLMAKGLYSGRIDGIAGGQTEAALQGFAAGLTASLTELGKQEARHAEIVSRGAPAAPKAHEASLALLIAFLLTSLSMAASAIGFPLMAGRKPEGETELKALEDTMDEFESEVFDFAQWLDDKRKAA
jgi:hypothetical protein